MSDSALKRFGVSMEDSLLKKFDQLVRQRGYKNRSEAVRDLVRDALIQQLWEDSEEIVSRSINVHKKNSSFRFSINRRQRTILMIIVAIILLVSVIFNKCCRIY